MTTAWRAGIGRERRLPARLQWGVLALLAPVAIYYGIFLAWPLGLTVATSLEDGASGYLTAVNGPLFSSVIVTTIEISVVSTVLSVVLAFVCAYAAVRASRRVRHLIIGLVLLPIVTSILVKTFAWTVILQENGVANVLLGWLGIIDRPLTLLHNRFAVYVGMVQYLVPYAFLPIYTTLRSQDKRLEHAAESLGASRRQVFARVIMPLALPGIAAATFLTGVIAVGFFIIPELLGGARDAMISNLVEFYARELIDFRTAAALSIIVFVAVGTLTVLYQRMARGRQYGGA